MTADKSLLDIMRDNSVRSLQEIEDKQFVAAVDAAIKHAEAMRERRRWRDGHGVVHALRPAESLSLSSAERRIEGWVVVCGYKRRSTVEHAPDLPLTCLTCLCEVPR